MINPFTKNHPISTDPLIKAEKRIEFYKGSHFALETLEEYMSKLALRLFVIATGLVVVSFFTQHRFFLFVDGILWGNTLLAYLVAYKLQKDIHREAVTLDKHTEHAKKLLCEKKEIAYTTADE